MLILLIALLSPPLSSAASSEENIQANVEKIEKAKTYLSKSSRCSLAIGTRAPDKSQWDSVFPKVLCVSDITLGKGTVHEKTACALTEFNIQTGEGAGVGAFGAVPIAKKKCADGGWHELLKADAVNTPADAPDYLSVKDMLTGRIQHNGKVNQNFLVFLFGTAPEWETKWKALYSK
jgi:hypothetical protein